MKNLKVLSYNIHKGVSFFSKKSTLSQMRDELLHLEPDLIFLQEVVGHESEVSQFQYLADEMWPHVSYGKNAVYDPGHHGNAILSRYPIIESDNIDLSTNRFERRGLLHALIKAPFGSRDIHAFSTHLNLLESARAKQLRKIVASIVRVTDPNSILILAGDFNDWRESAHHILKENLRLNEAFLSIHGRCAQSFPSFFPKLCLDRIYFRGLEILSARRLYREPWPTLSDHLPIEGVFALHSNLFF